MEVGVIFPQTEIEPDPLAIKDFAQAAEEMGYSRTPRATTPTKITAIQSKPFLT